jgi:hypothetical protein
MTHQDRKHPQWLRPINLLAKRAGERSAGNLHAPFDVAGDGNQLTVLLVRHSQRKRGATDRPDLRSMAPFLDPTRRRPPAQAPAAAWAGCTKPASKVTRTAGMILWSWLVVRWLLEPL